VIKSIDATLIIEVVGSFRRGSKDSGDIDVLITHPDHDTNDAQIEDLLKRIVAIMDKAKYTYDAFALGNKKYLGVSKVKYGRHFRRLDLLLTHKHEFPFALLYFTGSQQFNVDMRNYCISKGYSLSEYGLKYLNGEKKGQFVEKVFTTEADVFEYLGLKYIAPKDRTGNIIDSYRI
jgi:DNA polymerase/3'-5' exonuclease PolX